MVFKFLKRLFRRLFGRRKHKRASVSRNYYKNSKKNKKRIINKKFKYKKGYLKNFADLSSKNSVKVLLNEYPSLEHSLKSQRKSFDKFWGETELTKNMTTEELVYMYKK